MLFFFRTLVPRRQVLLTIFNFPLSISNYQNGLSEANQTNQSGRGVGAGRRSEISVQGGSRAIYGRTDIQEARHFLSGRKRDRQIDLAGGRHV